MVSQSQPPLLLPASLLSPTPSYQSAGVPYETQERRHRIFGCELISEAGTLLRLPQACIATAETLLQRFYYRVSLSHYDVVHASMAALFLAAKVEDQLDDHKLGKTMRMRDILNVFFHIKRNRQGKRIRPLSLGARLYNHWKERLTTLEMAILKELGFSMYNIMEHPHKFILYYVRALEGSQELARNAWAYLNDSLRLDLCVRFRAESIACAAIYLASRKLGYALPMNPPWYRVFNTTEADIVQISADILKLYQEPKLVWLESLCDADHNFDEQERSYEKDEDQRIDADIEFDQKVQKERENNQPVPSISTSVTNAATASAIASAQAKAKEAAKRFSEHKESKSSDISHADGQRRKKRRWK